MSKLRKEWTDEEIGKLERDLRRAKINVLIDHDFSIEEVARIIDLPIKVILEILREHHEKESE